MTRTLKYALLGFALICGIPAGANAERLELLCEGNEFLWTQGVGNGTAIQGRSTRVVQIDTDEGTISWDTIYGPRTARLLQTKQSFAAIFDQAFEAHGTRVLNESLSVNRSTGEAHWFYDIGRETKYGAFNGECRKAARRF